MPERLAGKVAIVTGGTTGIGRAIAATFLAEGAKVVVCAPTQKDLEAADDCFMGVACDVSDAAQVQNLVQRTVTAFGRLDVLVNNAGIRGSTVTAEHLTEEEWQRTFDVDAKGSWLCSKYAVPQMRSSGGGSIIMISSVSAHVGQRMQGCYNAAKAAQESLMKCMALDFASDHIRVNAICPGWVRTDMNRDELARMKAEPNRPSDSGLTYEQVVALHPIGRLGEPQDIAWAAVLGV